MASPQWYDYVHTSMAVAGLKRSRARDRIIDVLSDQTCAVTATELEQLLRAEGRRIARATIYRTLDLLVDHGLAERVFVDSGQTRYEPLEPSGRHHHHLLCGQCRRLVAFDDPSLEYAIEHLPERLGLTVDSHEVLLRGVCDRCA